MYRVVISPSANADLFDALEYIAHELENPQAATKLADGIERCYADLERFPAAHELCRDPGLARIGYRRYAVGNYLVIFRIAEEWERCGSCISSIHFRTITKYSKANSKPLKFLHPSLCHPNS